MADQPYTEADVKRAMEAVREAYYSRYGKWRDQAEIHAAQARAVLDALAAAGRLLPEGARAAECGCPITVEAATITRHTRECGNREAAARFAAHIADEYGSTDE